MKTSFLFVLFCLLCLMSITGCFTGCPLSCDDKNICTEDYCSEKTNFTCFHAEIKPCLGNSICEPGEYPSKDCPNCDDNTKCTTHSIDYTTLKCIRQPITPCCGNKHCEEGEDYKTCLSDCEAPDKISDQEALMMSKIYISEEVDKTLEKKWSPSGDEFRVCLYVKKYKDSYLINKLYDQGTVNASQYAVWAYDCPSDSVGFIQGHTLGGGICMLSTPSNMEYSPYNGINSDVETFVRQEFPLTGVICGPEKYVFFTKKDTAKSLSVFVVENDIYKDVTAINPCPGNRFCLGKCWGPCASSRNTWVCRSNGALCI